VLSVESGLFSLRPVPMRALPLVLQRLTPATTHLPGLFHPGAILGVFPFRVCSPCKPDTSRFAVPFFLLVSAHLPRSRCRQSGACCQDVASLLPPTLLSHQMLTCTLMRKQVPLMRRQRRLLPQDPRCFRRHC